MCTQSQPGHCSMFIYVIFVLFQTRRADALDMDRLDEELDQFLDRDPVDHNFAITTTGERVTN